MQRPHQVRISFWFIFFASNIHYSVCARDLYTTESGLPNTFQWMALPRFLLFFKTQTHFWLFFHHGIPPFSVRFLAENRTDEWPTVPSTTGFRTSVLLGHAFPLEGIGHTHTPPHTCPWMQRPKRGLPGSVVVGRKWKREICGLYVLKGARQSEFQLLTGVILIKCKALGPLSPSPKRNCKPSEAHQVMWHCSSRSQAFQATVFYSCSMCATWAWQMSSVCSSFC